MSDILNYKGYLSVLSKDDLIMIKKALETYQIKYKDTLGIDPTTTFGVEIEFNKTPLSLVKESIANTPKFFGHKVVTDVSVGEIINGEELGGEISTKIMRDKKEDWQNLSEVLLLLKSLNATITDNCSSHIHIGSQILGLNTTNIIRFLKVWSIFEDIIYKFSLNGNHIRKGIYLYAGSITPININDLNYENLKNLCLDRSKGLNLRKYHPTAHEELDNTIEIRTPNGTLNPITIENNVNFFISLLNYVKSDLYDEEIITNIYKRIKPNYIEDCININFKKAIILADLIFKDQISKLDFLYQYLYMPSFNDLNAIPLVK